MTEYLSFPEADDIYPAVYSIGRMAVAWGHLEHQFFALLSALIALPQPLMPSGPSGEMGRAVDFDAATAIYFSQDSSRGRRKMVVDLTRLRHDAGLISDGLRREIIAIAESAQKAAKERNIYSHSAIRFHKSGKIEVQASDTLTRAKMYRRRPPSEIDKVTDEIRRVSDRVHVLVIATLYKPLESPPPASARA